MPSEYDPFTPRADLSGELSDLERVRPLFEEAAVAFLASPWTWVSWAIVLPVTALVTPLAEAAMGSRGVVTLWSFAIILGGVVEGVLYRRRAGGQRRSPLAGWVLKVQGNLSLVAAALSGVAVWMDRPQLLPGIWLLILGHSFYAQGALAFPPLRTTGWIFQLGGLVALVPSLNALHVFAVATAVGNFWTARAVARRRREIQTVSEDRSGV